jgi:hypothetical protein
MIFASANHNQSINFGAQLRLRQEFYRTMLNPKNLHDKLDSICFWPKPARRSSRLDGRHTNYNVRSASFFRQVRMQVFDVTTLRSFANRVASLSSPV